MHIVNDSLSSRLRIVVVGAGGNGSMLLPHLARIATSLRSLGRRSEIEVSVYDPDTVSEANLGRQAFSPSDLGLNKAVALVNRINLFFGLDWSAHPTAFNAIHYWPGVVITCVDRLAVRKEFARQSWGTRYWLDLGNGSNFGQVVLGGWGLPTIFDINPSLMDAEDDPDEPSCSVAESLARQDLFINSALANYAGQLVWTMLRTGQLEHHGFYINLRTGRTAPIPVPTHAATKPTQKRARK
ncbi:MAG: PRTRC system ThiF family protein [Opitutus sp.]|nr:PRTRC system ThiF family protein [Opitutus sp.]